jgi:hypothetical protein
MDEAPVAGPVLDQAAGPFSTEQLAQLEAWAKEDGHHPDLNAPAVGSDTGATVTAELNAETIPDAFGGNVKAVDYLFETPVGAEPMPMPQQIEARNALAAQGVPADIGSEFARRWNAVAKAGPQDDGALELGMTRARAQLEQMHGGRLPQVLADARAEAVALCKRVSWLRSALENTQLGNDVWVVSTLANLAQARRASRA